MVKLVQAYSAPTKTNLAESSVTGQYEQFSLRNRLRGSGSLPVWIYHSEGGSLKNSSEMWFVVKVAGENKVLHKHL